MTFRELISRYCCKPKTYQGIFFFSKRVKNLDDYISNKDQEIDFPIDRFDEWYQSGLPIERFTKEAYFCGIPFHLLDNVFCPRHETELIVEEINRMKDLKGNYIDICSGTGAIGIVLLKRNPHWNGTLLDISPDAERNIKLNLNRHHVTANVVREDWLSYLIRNPNYQIITANFPYVSLSDEVDEDLTDPHISLFASDDGWEHYGKLIKFLKTNDYWKLVVLECSAHHLDRWKNVEGLRIRLVMDINDHLRVAVITR